MFTVSSPSLLCLTLLIILTHMVNLIYLGQSSMDRGATAGV
jgi:hypothetical protein